MRVLVVEDEKRLADTLQWGLEADAYAVDVAGNGLDGLRLAEQHPYQVIILDIMLPGMNGYRVCAELRRRGNHTPILMLTAKDGEYDEAEALDTGADDFLRKPFSYLVLTARLRALMRRGPIGSASRISVGDLTIDSAKRTCHRGSEVIPLTAKEFAVLECLARHSGQVMSKQDILDHVWDMAFQGDPNIVEVYVSTLRRKIGSATITTVRGVGYRLDV